jgi:hypothetical protein
VEEEEHSPAQKSQRTARVALRRWRFDMFAVALIRGVITCSLASKVNALALGLFPHAGVVATAREYAAATPLINPTGLRRSDYLRTIHGIVSFFRPLQAASGGIIDPHSHREVQYSTPCYALGAALMVSSGTDASFLDSAALAVDSSLAQLGNHSCASA